MPYEAIIGALATAVVGLSGYVVKLHREIRRLNEDRIKAREAQIKLLSDLLKEME